MSHWCVPGEMSAISGKIPYGFMFGPFEDNGWRCGLRNGFGTDIFPRFNHKNVFRFFFAQVTIVEGSVLLDD